MIVFPHMKVERLNVVHGAELGHKGIEYSIREALEAEYVKTSVFVVYNYDKPESKYMLTEEATRHVIGLKIHYYVVDLDTNPHENWPDYDIGKQALKELIDIYNCIGYVTPRGIRLVFPLDTPVPIDRWVGIANRLNTAVTKNISSVLSDYSLILDDHNVNPLLAYVLPIINNKRRNTVDYHSLHIPEAEVNFKIEDITGGSRDIIVPDKETRIKPAHPIIDTDQKIDLLQPLSNKLDDELLSNLINGEPFFVAGERHNKIVSLTFKLSRLLSDVSSEKAVPPEILYSIMYESVKNGKTKTAPEKSLDELWGCCVSACTKVAANILQERERRELESKSLYSDLPPLVFYGKMYYVLNPDTNTYLPAITNEAAVPGIIERYAENTGLSVRNAKGTILAMNEILARYGTQASDVVYVMASKKAAYDKETGVLQVGCCYPKQVEPIENDKIAEWLWYLAGEDKEDHNVLLDWLATSQMLSSPTQALYLRGKKGAGKGMLAAALSSVYGVAPTPFKEALARFNRSLLTTPITLIDEGIAPSNNLTEVFRSMVSERTRKVEPKYGESVSVFGCYRNIIAANNLNALPISDKNESDDIEAVVDRVRFFWASDKAGPYLQKLGGSEYLERDCWVTDEKQKPGKIASHIQYLIETRKVDRGSNRFLTPPKETIWHRQVSLSNSRRNTIHALAKALLDTTMASVIAVDRENEIIYVNVSGLLKLWLRISDTSYIPTMDKLIDDMRALPKIGKDRYTIAGTQKRVYGFSLRHFIKMANSISSDLVDDIVERYNIAGAENE